MRNGWFASMPKWLRRDAAIWCALLGLWCPVVFLLGEHHSPRSSLIGWGGALGAVAIAATIGLAVRLGYRRLWKRAAQAILVGTATMGIWYSALLISAPDPTNQNDHTAGIGAVFLSIPTAVLLSILIGSGALAGRLSWAISGRVRGDRGALVSPSTD